MNFIMLLKSKKEKKLNNTEEIVIDKIIINDDLSIKEEKIKILFKNFYHGSSSNFFDLSNKISNLYNVYINQNSNDRNIIAVTKKYCNSRGSSKKPRPQKGTGRSRQGSSRSSIIRGGIKIFGPQLNKNYKCKINKKSLKLAFNCAFLLKFCNEDIFFLKLSENIKIECFKTKYFNNLIYKIFNNNLRQKKIYLVVKKKNLLLNIIKIIKNIEFIDVLSFKDFKLRHLLSNRLILFDYDCLSKIIKSE